MHVGIQIQLDGERTLRNMIRLFNEMARSDEWKEEERGQPWPMEVQMPCGFKRIFQGPEDFPLEDLECPCQEDNHWVVRWM